MPQRLCQKWLGKICESFPRPRHVKGGSALRGTRRHRRSGGLRTGRATGRRRGLRPVGAGAQEAAEMQTNGQRPPLRWAAKGRPKSKIARERGAPAGEGRRAGGCRNANQWPEATSAQGRRGQAQEHDSSGARKLRPDGKPARRRLQKCRPMARGHLCAGPPGAGPRARLLGSAEAPAG